MYYNFKHYYTSMHTLLLYFIYILTIIFIIQFNQPNCIGIMFNSLTNIIVTKCIYYNYIY